MKEKKIIIILIIINILTIGVIYNLIKKDYLNNTKIIVKAMTETEYENNINSLNTSHEDFVNYIKESKTKIASAITEMGVTTSEEENLETMVSNIKSIKGGMEGTASRISTMNNNTTPTTTILTLEEDIDTGVLFISTHRDTSSIRHVSNCTVSSGVITHILTTESNNSTYPAPLRNYMYKLENVSLGSQITITWAGSNFLNTADFYIIK